MDVFQFREHLVGECAQFSRSFTRLRSDDIREFVDREYASQRYWPEPLVRLAGELTPERQQQLGLHGVMTVHNLRPDHQAYLRFHRGNVWRG